jgi:tetratricopeptide (TPR) repeat protein
VSDRAPLVLLAVVVLVVGCDRAPRRVATPPAVQSFEELRADGAARLAARDWEGALRAYQAALAVQADNREVRYGLAIALSQLDRVDEAGQAFAWIVEHGSPDDESVRVARQWLASTARPSTGEPTSGRAAAGDSGRGLGTVRGQTEWPHLTPGITATLQILLEGDDAGTRDRRYWAKVGLNRPYEIADVAPGNYRLKAQVGPVRLWETRVAVERGRAAVVDLTRATAVASADALRPASAP